jgi:hypothetical protein
MSHSRNKKRPLLTNDDREFEENVDVGDDDDDDDDDDDGDDVDDDDGGDGGDGDDVDEAFMEI